MSAFLIDAFEFCRLKEHRNGEIPIADLPRLASEIVDPSGTLKWRLEGGKNALGYPQLSLAVAGSVKLACQRCLQPFDFAILSDSILILAPDEASADEIEEALDDDSVDVIVGSKALDLLTLIEDDALLALPISPRHATCPDKGLPESVKLPEKESPFSVLKTLKKS
jgi:uncharacterized protein